MGGARMRWLRWKDRQTPAPASTVAIQSARKFNAHGNDEIEIYEGVFDPPQSNTGRNRRTLLMLCLR